MAVCCPSPRYRAECTGTKSGLQTALVAAQYALHLIMNFALKDSVHGFSRLMDRSVWQRADITDEELDSAISRIV